MTNLIDRWARPAGLALLLTASMTMAASAAPTTRDPSTIRITEADVAESNDEIAKAYPALVAMWEGDFRQMGRRFVAPRIRNYRGNVRTSCGIMTANNAAYCPGTNSIYFDEVFLARQRKAAAYQLRSDGDMAGVGIIAHEMGHAVAAQLGVMSRTTYQNEAIADCLAGVFARHSERDGSLEEGDLEEAFAGLAAAGDPQIEMTGNQRVDERRVARARAMAHGTSEQRMSNFRTGYLAGSRGCIPGLRGS
jgi:predicted metalloprotease